MTQAEIKKAIDEMIILEDTREKECERHAQRVNSFPVEVQRIKLDVGDYSCFTKLPHSVVVDLRSVVCIDRKSSLEELIKNLSSPDRERFLAEVERAASAGMRLYILVEDADGWNKIFSGNYNSRYNSSALQGSIQALRSKYGVIVDFVSPDNSAKLIYLILKSELKKHIQGHTQKTVGKDILSPFLKEMIKKYNWDKADFDLVKKNAAQAGIDLEDYIYIMDQEDEDKRSREYLEEIFRKEQEEEWAREEEERHARFRRRLADLCRYGRWPVDIADLSCV